jgi:hypothetical protein
MRFMLELVSGRAEKRPDWIDEIAARVEKIRSLAANSGIGGEAEGHEISHQCRQILVRIRRRSQAESGSG